MTPKKYNRTFHLPFSFGRSNDDKVLDSCAHFLGKEVVLSSKLDGSNFAMTNDECFARSHNGPPKHSSFDWAKAFHGKIKAKISSNLAIYCEYMYALHSISYTSLPHYVNVFNVLDMERNVWLSWDGVIATAQCLNIPTVPLLYRGVINTERDLTKLCEGLMADKEFVVDQREGVVIRLAAEFADKDFAMSIAKNVRKNHVSPDNEHWNHQKVIKNGLKI